MMPLQRLKMVMYIAIIPSVLLADSLALLVNKIDGQTSDSVALPLLNSTALPIIHLLRISSMIDNDFGYQTALDVFHNIPRWNNRFSIRIDTRFTNRQGGSSTTATLRLAIRSLERANNTYVALLGPDYSSEAEPVSQIAPIYFLNSVSLAASEKFRDTSAFPLMFHPTPKSTESQAMVYELLERLGINHVCTLAFREQLFVENVVRFSKYFLNQRNHSIARSVTFGRDNLHDGLVRLYGSDDAVDYIVASTGELLPYAVCETYKTSNKLTQRPILIDFQTYDVRETWQTKLSELNFNCTLDEMRRALNGSFFAAISNPKFATDNASLTRPRHDGITLQQINDYMYKNAYKLSKNVVPIAQSYFIYDSAIALYTALYRADVLMQQKFGLRLHLLDKKTSAETWSTFASILHDEIAATSFYGSTSSEVVRFDANQTRIGGVELIQYQGLVFDTESNSTIDSFVRVGTFNSTSNEAVIDFLLVKFHTPTGEAPHVWRRKNAASFKQTIVSNATLGTSAIALIAVAAALVLFCLTAGGIIWQYKLPRNSATSLSSSASNVNQPTEGPLLLCTSNNTMLHVREVTALVARSAAYSAAELSKLFDTASAMHKLSHDNVNRFVGICIDYKPSPIADSTIAIVAFEYQPKDSLAELLMTTSWATDSELKLYFMVDCARGLDALHSANIVHGFLRSSSIVLDTKFTCKITNYGLGNFGRTSEEMQPLREVDDSFTDEALLKLIFRSPEQIRKGFGGCNVMTSDVYSLGIVFAQIMTGDVPQFVNSSSELVDYYEVLRTNIAGESGRKYELYLGTSDGPSILRQLSEECVSASVQRPTANSVLKRLKNIPAYSSRGVVDSLVLRLQRHATDLESMIADRTRALFEEASRTDRLLLEMLPTSVAAELKAGRIVPPETFECASIYFSEIDGFITISVTSTPFQVVELLNSIHTTFDTVLEKFRVYKVETIGDAYMVASGLPQRIGDTHAVEICNFALAMQKTIESSQSIRSEAECASTLQLRVGLHCGTCVGGVVGVKMPRYCLFGDTVNTASRMQSTGVPGRIQVSDAMRVFTELHFPVKFHWQVRGQIDVKGLGATTTHWLVE